MSIVKQASPKPINVGDLVAVECHVAECGCGELRFAELVCLPCDWPDDVIVQSMVGRNKWQCTCFDWPMDPEL